MAGQIICGSSDEILPKLVAKGAHFDLVLTDPPYNINKDFGNDSDKLPLDQFLSITRKRISLCHRLLAPEGSIIWFGIHKYIGFIQSIMYEEGFHYRRMNIWFYENGFSRARREPLTQYEPFLWFSNSDRKWTYNIDEVRVPYKSTERLKNPVYYTNSRGDRVTWVPNPKGAMRGDVWKYPTLAGKLFKDERTKHPTQKPESLITEIIKAFCPMNESGQYEGRIIDPFLGSGTVAVCCEKLNKAGHKIDWLGIELEKKWCEVANKRLQGIR